MSKLEDFNLTTDIKEISCEVNGITFMVKTGLKLNQKLEMYSRIISLAADDNKFIVPAKLRATFNVVLLDYITDIEFPEEMSLDELYDTVMLSGLFAAVVKTCGEATVKVWYSEVEEVANKIYEYNNSALGVVEIMATDYKDVFTNLDNLQNIVDSEEQTGFLKEVLTKMG